MFASTVDSNPVFSQSRKQRQQQPRVIRGQDSKVVSSAILREVDHVDSLPPLPLPQVAQSKTGVVANVDGVEVMFPFKPYLAQMQLMHGMIAALRGGDSAMLESPTGSGKTIALLSGALAWRMHHVLDPSSLAARASGQYDAARYAREHFRRATPADYESASLASVKTTRQYLLRESSSQAPRIFYCSRTHKQLEQVAAEMERYCAYQPRMVVLGSRTNYCINERVNPAAKGWAKRKSSAISDDITAGLVDDGDLDGDSSSSMMTNSGPGVNNSELREKCAALIEKRQCAPHSNLKTLSKKLEGVSPYAVLDRPHGVHDIEDLIREAREHSGELCPYYLAREMASSVQGAELILCPYTYIMDPSVRKSIRLDVDNAIVIVDEAHNVEQELRDSMSISLTNSDLYIINTWVQAVTQRMDEMCEVYTNVQMVDHTPIAELMQMMLTMAKAGRGVLQSAASSAGVSSGLQKLAVDFGGMSTSDGSGSSGSSESETPLNGREWYPLPQGILNPALSGDVLSRENTIAFLGSNGVRFVTSTAAITLPFLKLLDMVLMSARKYRRDLITASTARTDQCAPRPGGYVPNSFDEDIDTGLDDPMSALTQPILQTVEKLAMILRALIDPASSDRFAVTIENLTGMSQDEASRESLFRPTSPEAREIPRKSLPRTTFVLGIHCLAPDVPFASLAKQARSVILTSGTLSPMENLAAELRHRFGQIVSTNHVIQPSQTWAGVHSLSASGQALYLCKRTRDLDSEQLAMGETLLSVVNQVTSGGVLVFFPSYHAMESMMTCWKDSGLLAKMHKTKYHFTEPRYANSIDIAQFVAKYRSYIKSTKGSGKNGKNGKNGCLLFAVCRGKLAEGVDFPDDMCRAAVAVGVPFASLGSSSVTLKMLYNDRRYKSITGRDPRLMSSLSQDQKQQLVPGGPLMAFTGEEWYKADAYRAVNQALGRSIRHVGDWGAMCLVDARYARPENAMYLSGWIKRSLMRFQTHQEAVQSLGQFISSSQESF